MVAGTEGAGGAVAGLGRRILLVAACIVAGAALLAGTSRLETVPPRQSFAEFPMRFGDWQGQVLPDFDAQILAILGVDEYVNRFYHRSGGQPVAVYVGYYESQRQGDTMHSPLNCLPGAGWIPVGQGRATLQVNDGSGARSIEVNDFLIEKGLDRQVVLYWYQGHGRVVASEYWGKVYTVVDALQLNRTDGSIVRIVAPVIGNGADAEQRARSEAVQFVQEIFPHLSRFLPA
jgi:EpsI family protein